MAQQHGKGTHQGVLIRGANGALWFLRDDWDAPQQVSNSKLEAALESLVEKEEPGWCMYPLPDAVAKLLDEVHGIGPLFWCVGFIRADRLPQ